MLLMAATPMAARADLVHRLTTSTQLSVDAAYTSGTRLGSTYTVSGSNIKVASSDDHFGKLAAPSGTAAATLDPGVYDINTAGSAFSFSESFTAGDATNTIGSGVDVISARAAKGVAAINNIMKGKILFIFLQIIIPTVI